MHRFMTPDLLAEYDLHHMADDGCPLVQEPVGWGDDDDWRDNTGVWDTFADDEPTNCLAPGFDNPP